MTAILFTPIVANTVEILIWVVLAVAWVVIQAVVKNAQKGNAEPSVDSNEDIISPESELDHFLTKLVKQAEEEPKLEKHEPERSPPQTPRPVYSFVKNKHPKKTRVHPQTITRLDMVNLKTPLQPEVETSKKKHTLNWLQSVRSSADWRKAVVYREVMGPPKALRELEMATPGRGE